MTYPIVDSSILPGLDGVECAGHRHKSHIVRTRVYRIERSTVYLCADCLLRWGADYLRDFMQQGSRRRRIRRTRGCTSR